MKNPRIPVIMGALALSLTASASPVSSFDDIQFWTGSGPNRSALVVDFQYGGAENSPVQSFVWGYRWEGSATGSDMLAALSAANAFFAVDSTFFPSTFSYTHLGNAYTQASYFDNDISWGYYLSGGSSDVFDGWDLVGTEPVAGGGTSLPTEWTSSPAGATNRYLADGSWDAWSFGSYDPAANYEHVAPPSTTPHAAIPEPGTLVLLLGGLLTLARFVRRKGAQ